MARKVSQSDPALAIEFFLSGFYTHRSQLFAPFKGIGVNVVSFHDPVIDGENMEDTDLFEWQRRPGFSIFCPIPLNDLEVVDEFYDARNLNGEVLSFFDSTQRLATFTDTEITSVISKTTTEQGFITVIGNMVYFSDGASVDLQKWESLTPFSVINPSPWGIPAPTLTPSIFNRGCWLPFTNFVNNNAILDPNGSVEVVTNTFGGSGISGANEPLWPTTTSSTVSDGSIQWTNMGTLATWFPATFFPVPVVILDTNGNLQLATATNPVVLAWDAATTYTVGITVSFAGEFWTSLVASTNVPPSAGTTTTTTVGSTSTTQPFWVPAQNPSQTGTYPTTPFTPTWNKTIGGTTVDGNYTWTNLGPGNLVESFGTSYVYAYRTIYGHLSTSSPVSINTGSIFGPVVATITGFSITGNVATFLGVNNFIPGNVFSIQGLSIGTYLNNQAFTVIAAGLTPTSFSAVFDFANTPATVDSGSTLNLIAAVTGVGNSSPLCNATSAITATEVVAGVVTIFGANDYVPGLQVTLTGLTVATFLNGLQFEIVNVDPLSQWFQVFFTNSLGVVPPDQPTTTDTGLVTFNAVEIYRVSDGGGIYLFTGAVTNPTGTIIIPFDSGTNTAGIGTDDGIPGTFPWTDPDNVTSISAYATTTVPTPVGGGSARFNPVQVCQNMAANQIGASTVVASFSVNVTANNTILLFVDTFQMTSWSVRDNQGNNYIQIAQHASPNDHGIITTTVYRAVGVSAGPTTVTLSILPETGTSHQDFAGFAAIECSGLNGTIDGTNGNFQNSGVNFNTGSVSPSAANSVVFTFGAFDLGTSSSLPAVTPAGFTRVSNQVVFDAPNGNSFQQMAVAYQVQTATGTFNPRWGTPASNKSLGVSVALDLSLFAPSDGLDAEDFEFSVPPSITVSGIEIDFESLFTGTVGFGILDVQLLKGGVPVGTIMQVLPTNSNVNYTLGGLGNLWGATWASSDFNSASWGVRIIATQLTGGTDATFSVRNVRARLTGGTSTTGWVFDDFTPDENLDVLQIAPQNHLNDPPPGAPGSSVNQVVGTLTTYWNGRIWMAVGNYVYFNAGPDCVNGVPEESWPPANRFQFAGPVIGMERTADGVGLLIYLADRVAVILGGPETISFYPSDALDNFGISNPNAIFRDGSTIGQFTTQKQYFELIEKNKEETGEHVADYLSANFDPAKTYVTMHRDGLDVGVFLSNGVDQVLRFGSNIKAWSVPAFPIGGAGALRSIETSVGVHSLMLASPVPGVSGATIPTNPSSGITAGTGTPWIDPSNITIGNPTDYATLTVVASAAQLLEASTYVLNIPPSAIISGVQVSITGKGQLSTVGFNNAGLGTDVSESGAIWANPNNITLNSPPTYAVVNLNEVGTNPVFSGQNSNSGGGATPNFTVIINCEATVNVNIGDTAVVMVFAEATSACTIGTPTDSLGNIWNLIYTETFVDSFGDTTTVAAFYATMVSAVAMSSSFTTTVPVHCLAGSINSEGTYGNISGGTLSLLSSGGFTGTGTSAPAGSGTLAPNQIVLGFISFPDGDKNGNPAGMTEWPNQGVSGGVLDAAYQFTTSGTASWANTWSQSSGLKWGGGFGVFSYTSAIPSADFSDILLASDYLFAIPANSAILGIEASISGLQSLVSATTSVTATLTPGGIVRTFNFTTSQSTVTFGGATDTWGLTLTPAEVNAAGFGLDIQGFDSNGGEVVSFSLSAAQLKIWYAPTLSVTPLNPKVGAESDTFVLGTSNTTVVFGGSSDLWGMPWASPFNVNQSTFGFGITAPGAQTADFSISEVQVVVFYQNPGNYLLARDLNSWGDHGQYGENDGTPYGECFITIGSITLSQPGAPMFPLQHVVGYFDAAGTLNDGAPSEPDIWILPNEINDTAGVGFVQLPEVAQEPPTGQNHPSLSLLSLRWPVNMVNSASMSQFIHHLQVKIQFEPESAPNTIKAIAFKQEQD